MEGPRPVHQHELPQLIDFLSNQLRPQQAWSIAEEYPSAIQPSNLNNVRVIKDRNQFLSAAVMKPMVIKAPAGIFKVAAIGSVVTEPNHRNQGLSRQVLEACLNAGQLHGCDFAVLWTNLYDFYRKLGFELAGSEISLHLPENFVAPEPPIPLRFLNSTKVDADAIFRLYSQHTCGTIRTVEEIRKYLAIPNSRVFTAWSADNKLQAYAVEGKGADLAGYIHEWGGGVSKLLPLLQFAQKEMKQPITVMAPAHAGNLIRQLKDLGATENSGVLGMIKLLNANSMLAKLKRFTRTLGIENLIMEKREGRFYLGQGENLFHTDSESDVTRLIFGPLKASQLHPFDDETSEAFERAFPIATWIWGWDSV